MLNNFKKKISSYFGDEYLDNQLKPISNYTNIASFLCYRSFDENSDIYINNDSFGFILEISPLVGGNIDTVKVLTGMLTDGMPVGCSMQFINWASPNISHIIDHWQQARDNSKEIYSFLAKKRADYLSKANWSSLFADSPYSIRDFRIFVAVSLPGYPDKKSLEQMYNLCQSIQTNLKSINISSLKLQPQEFINFLDEILHPEISYKKNILNYNNKHPLNLQLTHPENSLKITPDGIYSELSDILIRAFTARSYPLLWSQIEMTELLGSSSSDYLRLPYPYLISFSLTINDEAKENNRAMFKASRATQQAGTGLARYMPNLYNKQRDWQFVVDKLNQGQKLVRTFYQILLYAPKSQIETAEQSLKALYKANGWVIAREKFVQLQNFLAALPFTLSEGLALDLEMFGRSKNMISWTCANLAPLQGEYKGMQSPCMLLFGRRGQPFFWDPFANEEGNYNVAVIGKSGSGKSVFMQDYVTSVLGSNGRVFVIDDGRSFMNSCKIQGGQFIEFTDKANLCINPFSIIDENIFTSSNDYKTEVLKLINMIIRQMCRSTEITSDIENAYIEKAVSFAWNERQTNADISLIADYLISHEDKRANDLSLMLTPYTKQGIYASFFNGKANISPDEQLIVFELAELKNKKELQGIVMMLLMFLISETMYKGGRKQNTSMIIDEAWDLLHGKSTGEFIEGLARRARKYRGNIVTGTQSVNDYYKNPAAQAAIENTDWVCLLSQKKESIEQIKNMKRLAIDANMEQVLKSLRTIHHQYSEVMICGPAGYVVARLLLDPYSIALYSSKAQDYHLVQQLQTEGYSLADAISYLANKINSKESKR